MFILFTIHQMALGLFRMLGAVARDMIIANTFGSAALMVIFLLGGFILPKRKHHILGSDKILCYIICLKWNPCFFSIWFFILNCTSNFFIENPVPFISFF